MLFIRKYSILLIGFVLTLTFDASWAELRSGDLLLLPLHCYTCPLIEEESGSEFSHSGLVVKVRNEWMVIESLGRVKMTPLKLFIKKVRPGKRVSVYRFNEWRDRSEKELNIALLKRFRRRFEGLPFDRDYLWNNFDGPLEKLYCSEMVTKLINPFLVRKVKTYPMDFSLYYDFWRQYFNNRVPQGLQGNNPGTFSDSRLTHFIGFLN